MKPLRLLFLGGMLGTAGYWLTRYLRPEHSPLVLNNSVVLITGASAGIGRAYANAFARRGARIALLARRADVLEAVRQEITPYAADVLVVPADVTDDAALAAAVQTVLDRFGQIDVLINNAGLVEYGLLHTHDVSAIRQIVSVNLASSMALTRLVLPSMLVRRSGVVVNVSSMAGVIASAVQPAYGPTKAGLIMFSDALRRGLFGTGVEVVSVMPSWTYTDMVSSAQQAFVQRIGMQIDTPDYVAERTIDGILKGERDILLGGLLARAGAWLDRHFPMLGDAVARAVFTPQVIAEIQGLPQADAQRFPSEQGG